MSKRWDELTSEEKFRRAENECASGVSVLNDRERYRQRLDAMVGALQALPVTQEAATDVKIAAELLDAIDAEVERRFPQEGGK